MLGHRGGQGGTAPVNVGDELDVKIEAVGEKGDGIAKKDGFVLFIPRPKQPGTPQLAPRSDQTKAKESPKPKIQIEEA